MKAINITCPWEVGICELPSPKTKHGEALIKVRAAGICGSDIGAFRGVNPLVSYPRIIGHEIAGEIEFIPDGNQRGLKAGDRVILDPFLYCGKCYPCRIGRTNCCVDLKVIGVHVDGGMSEYIAHPAEMLHAVPDNISWEVVPLAEPLAIALHGLHRAQIRSDEHIAIMGAGPIGLLAAMAAKHYGAVPIMVDPVDERLSKARELGVRHTINPVKEDVYASTREITGGQLCEIVMEASGATQAVLDSLALVSHAGRIILTGWPKEDISLPTAVITRKEIDIRGARTSAGEFNEALTLISDGSIDVHKILTKTVSIDQAPQMIRDIDKNPGSFLKVNINV